MPTTLSRLRCHKVVVKEEFLLFCLNTSEILEIFISNIGNLYSNKNIIEYTNFVIKKP